MREIKFRAWNKIEKCFFMWDVSFAFVGTDKIWGDIQQYTGLKDKNWKEIYEGDIVIYGWKNWKGKIIFYNYAFYVEDLNDGKLTLLSDTNITVEVIGNIHENDLTKNSDGLL